MKKNNFLLFLLLLIYSCKQDIKNSKEYQSLLNERDSLIYLVNNQANKINELITDINDIQDNLNKIKEHQNIITNLTHSPEKITSSKEKIIDDILFINQLMEKNKELIEKLKKQLKNSNLKVESLEKMIANYEKIIKEKDEEILILKAKLEELNIKIIDLNKELDSLKLESEIKDRELLITTQELNTAYYAIGTKKELIKLGILTKKGGFIGIGKLLQLKDNFNKDYFTKIDITMVKEIPLYVKKAEIVTTHPKSTYEFYKRNNIIEKLIIKNYKEFWSISKYLIIVVEN